MPPLAPRPFVQLARRRWRLRIALPRGYAGSIDVVPWYRRQRRRAVFVLDRRRARELRRNLAEIYTRYQRCEVA